MVSAVGSPVSVLLYVDDAIVFSSQSSDIIRHELQVTINHVSCEGLKNGFFSTSTANTQCVQFTRLQVLHAYPSHFLNNSTLLFAAFGKFLALDRKLLWDLT
jgi:hypothetical protein